ncbi:MAG: restriction endonuclease subunit S [Pseudomonadota bacterium]
MSEEVRPGYKRTEVGVIPEDWEMKPLGEIGESLIGLTYRPSDVCLHGGTLVLRSSNVQEGGLRFEDNVFVEAEIPQRIMVRPDDILICVRNGSRDLIGKSAIIDRRAIGMTFGAFMAVFRSPNGRFIQYLFQSDIIKRQINEHLGATINQITNKSLNSFRVPFPPTNDEQHAIAEALSDVDALLGALDRLIAKKHDLKQAAMQQLLTGQTRLPGFHGEWEVKRLGDVADTDPENLSSGTRPNFTFNYISLEDVDCGFLRSHTEQLFANAPSRARRKLRTNDVLVSTVRPNLQSHLLFDGDAGSWVCSTGFCVVRCHEGITNPGYIFSHLFAACVNRQIETFLTGSNYPAIKSGQVRALQIPFPNYVEQNAIAEVLSDMDAELSSLEQRRNKTQALKQGMMQELLTGKIRLLASGGCHG